ncbi:unnamed protein product [Microthlaspi erraticum]|uniref:RDR1/2-like RRM domain-containing protein n=1 Tax=Microthlaspi erraticum TaxID=1685480 RepID=A0A6D2IWN1_9BRAS|nr:unnamed protein product [Microthlaspi erraticum]CAA7029871.1 unnamed protein product [Microthlaspi erraticum]
MCNLTRLMISLLILAKVLQALESAGVFTSGGLVKDKVLFWSTEVGRTSFVRQLEPDKAYRYKPRNQHTIKLMSLLLAFVCHETSTTGSQETSRSCNWTSPEVKSRAQLLSSQNKLLFKSHNLRISEAYDDIIPPQPVDPRKRIDGVVFDCWARFLKPTN